MKFSNLSLLGQSILDAIKVRSTIQFGEFSDAVKAFSDYRQNRLKETPPKKIQIVFDKPVDTAQQQFQSLPEIEGSWMEFGIFAPDESRREMSDGNCRLKIHVENDGRGSSSKTQFFEIKGKQAGVSLQFMQSRTMVGFAIGQGGLSDEAFEEVSREVTLTELGVRDVIQRRNSSPYFVTGNPAEQVWKDTVTRLRARKVAP